MVCSDRAAQPRSAGVLTLSAAVRAGPSSRMPVRLAARIPQYRCMCRPPRFGIVPERTFRELFRNGPRGKVGLARPPGIARIQSEREVTPPPDGGGSPSPPPDGGGSPGHLPAEAIMNIEHVALNVADPVAM